MNALQIRGTHQLIGTYGFEEADLEETRIYAISFEEVSLQCWEWEANGRSKHGDVFHAYSREVTGEDYMIICQVEGSWWASTKIFEDLEDACLALTEELNACPFANCWVVPALLVSELVGESATDTEPFVRYDWNGYCHSAI